MNDYEKEQEKKQEKEKLILIDKTDGFGSQFQSIIFYILYANFNNLDYIHKKIKIMDHNYNDDVNFIEKANKKHNNKYDYSLVQLKNMNSKIEITCKEHGEFTQIAHSHTYGSGCPSCNESKGEREIKILLEKNKINYIKEHSFPECKLINKLRFDFYLPNINTCIEFDGEQHFKPIEYYGGKKEFEIIIKRDKIKSDFFKSNNINLIRVKFNDSIKNKLIECLL